MLQEVVDEYLLSLSSEVREDERGRTGGGNGGNANTTAAYRNDLHQLCTYLMQQDIANWPQVSREHIAGYILEMREGQAYRSATIARKLAALKSFFRYMQRMEYIASNPVETLEAPRVQKELPGVLSAEQIGSLFHQIEVETPTGQRDLAMLHMLYATGMRVTELISLNLSDFDPVSATVTCSGRKGRNKRERLLPLTPLVVEAVQQYLQHVRSRLVVHHPEEQALFVNHHGEPLTRQGFWLIIKGYARQAGITEITPHMLRHSFAMMMLNRGMELRSLQELLGHAHITTTQVYRQLVRTKK